MPRAEVGSTKWISNQQKSRGLQRLRWYCQVCERQFRDDNAFKMHTQSESHYRNIMLVNENVKGAIDEFSNQFLHDFTQQLRTAHGTKSVHINHFYQEYIANKTHIHMNATRWPSLTEFAKYLGRESICRVEETEKGLHIAWIDNSPEALRRAEAIRRKEMQDKGDEEREQMMIREQQRRAEKAAEARRKGQEEEDDEPEAHQLQRQEGEKIKLSFGAKPAAKEGASPPPAPPEENRKSPKEDAGDATPKQPVEAASSGSAQEEVISASKRTEPQSTGFKFGVQQQTKNVFAQAKKNALANGGKKSFKIEQPKKISEAERIMREEMERKRSRDSSGFGAPNKKQRR